MSNATVSGVVVGAVIGLGVGAVSNWVKALIDDWISQRKEKRAAEADKEKSVAQLQVKAAEDIQPLYRELVKVILHMPRIHTEETMEQIGEPLRLADEIKQHALYLPNDLASRIRLLVDIATHATELAAGKVTEGYHFHSAGTILDNCEQELIRELSAFLRHKPLQKSSALIGQQLRPLYGLRRSTLRVR